jgi:hypothetical protein
VHEVNGHWLVKAVTFPTGRSALPTLWVEGLPLLQITLRKRISVRASGQINHSIPCLLPQVLPRSNQQPCLSSAWPTMGPGFSEPSRKPGSLTL